MNRDQAFKLVTDWTKNRNLVKHMLAVEAQMRGLAKHFEENEELWGLAGLVHDADYEKKQKDHPSEEFFNKLKELKADEKVIRAVKAHGWGYQDNLPEPKSRLDWSLYICDDLSGLIIACALVRPDPPDGEAGKKLASVKVESVLKKWNKKDFAAGVKREKVELCEEKLGIKLDKFIEICLKALQGISKDLEL